MLMKMYDLYCFFRSVSLCATKWCDTIIADSVNFIVVFHLIMLRMFGFDVLCAGFTLMLFYDANLWSLSH